MKWAVKAYSDWRMAKISSNESYDVKVDQANLEKLGDLTKSNLIWSLCKFIPEVTKIKDSSDYPGKILMK